MKDTKTQANPLAPRAGRGGTIPPKERQFGQPNGNKRGHGFWKKESTPRYKLEQMITLPESDIVKIANDKSAPLFERRLARSLIKENTWQVTEKMINQVYGMPKQEIEQKTIELQPILPKPKKKKAKAKAKAVEK